MTILKGDSTGTFPAGPLSCSTGLGTKPVFVALGDFDKNGKMDIATANDNDSISILLNTSVGVLSFGAAVMHVIADQPTSVAVGDFDHDTWPDLAVSRLDSSDVSLLYNTDDSSGLFNVPVDLSMGGGSYSVASGDFNNDTYDDIASSDNAGTQITVRLNTVGSAGTFLGAANYPTGPSPMKIVVGNFNNDAGSYPDLAVTNNGGSSVSLLMNNNNGTFAVKVDYTTSGSPTGLSAGDLNGDGKLDLAVACQGSNKVSTLLNSGTGTFSASDDYAAGVGSSSVIAGNFNSDGFLDLAVANRGANTISVKLHR